MACFTHEEDDQRFSEALIERLAEFAPEFDFLGFTHYVTESRSKRFMVGRKTQGSRISRKLEEVGVRLARLRPSGGRAMMDYAKRHLQGHIAYYGISGNSRSLKTYVYRVSPVLFKWLNRRSQRKGVK